MGKKRGVRAESGEIKRGGNVNIDKQSHFQILDVLDFGVNLMEVANGWILPIDV